MIIPYNKLPGYNKIFLDYIDDFEKLASFYESDFRVKEDYLYTILDKQHKGEPTRTDADRFLPERAQELQERHGRA